MTSEEAINYIKECGLNIENPIHDIVKDCVIDALEKQIPKKPIDICTPVVTWGLCPECKGELNKLGSRPNRVFESNHYCPDCGQALDWGDTE